VTLLYKHTEAVHNLSAPREVVPIVLELVRPQSVLDIGCGTATWLKAFEELGVQDYLGVDGDYVDRSLLKIDSRRFKSHDLMQPLDLQRKFDLVIALEVAEHLPERDADTFVESMVRHGDTLLFSAAIPGQGGQNHLNEQWPEYWEAKFRRHGFFFHDAIRPRIWKNERVDVWYKQNIFLVRRNSIQDSSMRAVVHPDLFSLKLRNQEEYRDSLLLGKQGLRISAAIFLNALIYKVKNLLGLE